MLSLILLCIGVAVGGPVYDAATPPTQPPGPPIDQGELIPGQDLSVPPNGTVEHENDMIITKEQHDMLFETDETGRTKRKAWKGDKFRWTDNTMPYFFKGNDYTDDQKTKIREAMDVYEKLTCLKFREATSSDVNKVRFQQGQGCNSQLGMKGGTQNLNLDSSGCRWMGLYWHEIGHAIGLVHEHQLPDRDNWVTINWPNVDPALYSAFSTYRDNELDRFGIPFDLASVMHYGLKAFSKTGGQTIIPRDKSKASWVGTVWISQLSFTDVMIINRMYKCSAKCAKMACEGGFVNKECKCVTPQSYFDANCINEHTDEEECYERAHKGDCDTDYDFMNNKCRKACNRCAMYGMEKLIKGKPGECFNQYFDDARCDKWAADGDCDKYSSFMKRQCRKSCKTCNSEWGKCLNMDFDKKCDDWKERGQCEKRPEFMKNTCPDSCGSCGYITRGKCENGHPKEEECVQWSREGQCVDEDITRAIWMKKNCAASCNSCGFGKGQCENELDDFECDKKAFHGECDTEAKTARRQCRKSCNSCSFGVRGKCKNLEYEQWCINYADSGNCDRNPGWHIVKCAGACNKCDEFKDLQTNCRDVMDADKCTLWKERGECSSNPGYVKYNCAKSCKSCHILTEENICTDLSGVTTCMDWRQKGECAKNKSFMKKNCPVTCGFCDSGQRIVNEKPWPKCENVGNDKQCDDWTKKGECTKNRIWMLRMCSRSCNNVACGGVDLENFCENKLGDEKCNKMMKKGECNRIWDYMKGQCFKACSARCDGGKANTGGNSNNNKNNGGNTKSACVADNKGCKGWAAAGECENNPKYMMDHCSLYCKTECGGDPNAVVCKADNEENCRKWADGGQCEANPGYMMTSCSKYCSPECGANTNRACGDYKTDCPKWAKEGQCTNPTVKGGCPKSCKVCK